MRQRMAAILCLVFIFGGALGITIGMVANVQAQDQGVVCCSMSLCTNGTFEVGSKGPQGCKHYGTYCDSFCQPGTDPGHDIEFQ